MAKESKKDQFSESQAKKHGSSFSHCGSEQEDLPCTEHHLLNSTDGLYNIIRRAPYRSPQPTLYNTWIMFCCCSETDPAASASECTMCADAIGKAVTADVQKHYTAWAMTVICVTLPLLGSQMWASVVRKAAEGTDVFFQLPQLEITVLVSTIPSASECF